MATKARACSLCAYPIVGEVQVQQTRVHGQALRQRCCSLVSQPVVTQVPALQDGVIRKHVSLVDPAAVGLAVSVFVHVSLEKQVEKALKKFEDAIRTRPEVMECYLMTGDADYLLRVVCADLGAYERFLLDHLTQVPGVASIRSSFALKQVKYSTALPVAG